MGALKSCASSCDPRSWPKPTVVSPHGGPSANSSSQAAKTFRHSAIPPSPLSSPHLLMLLIVVARCSTKLASTRRLILWQIARNRIARGPESLFKRIVLSFTDYEYTLRNGRRGILCLFLLLFFVIFIRYDWTNVTVTLWNRRNYNVLNVVWYRSWRKNIVFL